MASVYRRKYCKPDGRRVECSTYTVECKVGDAFHRLPGFKDKRASEELGRKVERLDGLRASGEQPDLALTKWLEGLPTKLRLKLVQIGLLDGQAMAATKPLAEHLEHYRQALLDGVASPRQRRPATTKHADLVTYRVETLATGIGAAFLSDVTAEAVGRYLAERRAKGELSVQTCNNYLKDCKAFFNWLVRARRWRENPIARLTKQQVTTKSRKHVRRVMEHAEAASLLRAARRGPERFGMTGEERYWLYRLALETALRSSELRTLTRANFELEDAEPTVWVLDDDTKNRQRAELPLRPRTARELRRFLGGKPGGTPVFPMPGSEKVVRMLRHDLKAARIPYETASGVVDFHSLRSTCLSWLAAAGVPLKTLQTFARHSTPVLTMNVYTHNLHGSLAGAAGLLPDLPESGHEALRATGTDSAVGGCARYGRCHWWAHWWKDWQEDGSGKFTSVRCDSRFHI